MESFQKHLTLFSYKLQAFTQNEILNLIPIDILNTIKQKDPHPYFQLYSLCHEGTSQPKLLGEANSKPIFWPRQAIQSLKKIVLKGIKLFSGHNEDNSTKGRESFGEVIHSFQQELQGNLNHLIITYHTSEQKEQAKKCDIVSQEGIWNFMESASNLIADTIEKITGIAGGSSETDIPAFSGAKRLGLVQAFEKKPLGDNMSDEQNRIVEKVDQISFKQWRDMKHDFHVHPWQLFSIDDLKNDREFGKYFTELDSVKKENVSLKEKYDNETKKLSEKINSYERKNYENTSKQRLDKMIEKENLPEKMKLFVEKAYEKEKANIKDLSDDGLKEFIDSKKDNFQNVMSIIDVKLPDSPPEKNKEDKAGGIKEEKDPTKTEFNEFLSEDIDYDDI